MPAVLHCDQNAAAGWQQRYFCLLSDGDCNAGATWEAILLAGHHHFDNLTAIVDYNRVQALGYSKDILDLEPLDDTIGACGWAYREGYSHVLQQIDSALETLPFEKGKPSWLTARTAKGKGVSFMENTVSCHYGWSTTRSSPG